MKIVNLFKYYGDNIVLDDINLEIKNKGLYLIYGDSGQGKSTLLNIIFKEENCNNGYIDYDNDKVSFCKSTNQLIEILTPLDMAYLISDNIELINKYFNYFSLNRVKYKKNSKLSSGERQRVQIILTLLSNSNVLLFDEPSSNLDIDTSLKLYSLLKEEAKNRAIVLVCHDFDNSSKYADAIYKLENHKLICKSNQTNEINNEGKETIIQTKGLIKYAIKSKKYHPFIGMFNLIFSCLLVISLTILLGVSFVNAKGNALDMSKNFRNDFFMGEYKNPNDKSGIELNDFCLELVDDIPYSCTGLFYEDLKDNYKLEAISGNECLISEKALSVINDINHKEYKIGSEIVFESYSKRHSFKIKGYNDLNSNFKDGESNLFIVVISKDYYKSFIEKYGYYDVEFYKTVTNFLDKNLESYNAFGKSEYNFPVVDLPNVNDIDENYNGYVYIGKKPVEIDEIMVSSIDLYCACNKATSDNSFVNDYLSQEINITDDNSFHGNFFQNLLGDDCLKEIKVVGCVLEIKNGRVNPLRFDFDRPNYISDKLFSLLNDKCFNEGKYVFDDEHYCFDKSAIKDIYPLIMEDKMFTPIHKSYIYLGFDIITCSVTLVIFIISLLVGLLYNNLISQYLKKDFNKLATYNFNKKNIFMFELMSSSVEFIAMIISLICGIICLSIRLHNAVKIYSYGSWKTNYLAVIALVIMTIIILFIINILFKDNINKKTKIKESKKARTWEE